MFNAQSISALSNDPTKELIRLEKQSIRNIIRNAALGMRKEVILFYPIYEVNKKWLSLLNFKLKEKTKSHGLDLEYSLKISWK